MQRLILAVALALVVPPSADAAILHPGSVLRITFGVDPALFFGEVPDVLRFAFSSTTGSGPGDLQLFNGATLLGDAGNAVKQHGFAFFRSPTSVFTAPALSPVTIDFSGILNGSINGILLYRIESGALDVSAISIDIRLMRGSGFTDHSLDLLQGPKYGISFVTSEVAADVVPEPATLALLGTGLLTLSTRLARGRLRTTRRS